MRLEVFVCDVLMILRHQHSSTLSNTQNLVMKFFNMAPSSKLNDNRTDWLPWLPIYNLIINLITFVCLSLPHTDKILSPHSHTQILLLFCCLGLFIIMKFLTNLFRLCVKRKILFREIRLVGNMWLYRSYLKFTNKTNHLSPRKCSFLYLIAIAD